MKNFTSTLILRILIFVNFTVCFLLPHLVPIFNTNTELCNQHFTNVTLSIIIFKSQYFQHLHHMYVASCGVYYTQFCCTTLQCDREIGPTLGYNKWANIWRLIFVCSMIIEHDLISDLIFVVNYFTIFADIIFINSGSMRQGDHIFAFWQTQKSGSIPETISRRPKKSR